MANETITIIIEDNQDIQHNAAIQQCSDLSCPCHQDALQSAWNELQSVPSYVEQQAALYASERD